MRWNHPTKAKERRVPKGKKVRSVPLLPEVAAKLDGIASRPYWTGPDDLVFVNVVRGAIDPSKTGKAYRKALATAGLKPIRFHDLRHTFGTLGVQVWELTKVQGYMGHTNIQTTMRYVHHVPKHDDAAKRSALVQAGLSI